MPGSRPPDLGKIADDALNSADFPVPGLAPASALSTSLNFAAFCL
jgi:hypothetical protein